MKDATTFNDLLWVLILFATTIYFGSHAIVAFIQSATYAELVMKLDAIDGWWFVPWAIGVICGLVAGRLIMLISERRGK